MANPARDAPNVLPTQHSRRSFRQPVSRLPACGRNGPVKSRATPESLLQNIIERDTSLTLGLTSDLTQLQGPKRHRLRAQRAYRSQPHVLPLGGRHVGDKYHLVLFSALRRPSDFGLRPGAVTTSASMAGTAGSASRRRASKRSQQALLCRAPGRHRLARAISRASAARYHL